MTAATGKEGYSLVRTTAAESLVLAGERHLHGSDMGRSSTAATADHPDAEVQQPVMVADHLLGRPWENRLAVPEDGESGVSLGDQWQRGYLAHGGKNFVDAVHPETTVRTDHVGPHRLKGYGGSLG